MRGVLQVARRRKITRESDQMAVVRRCDRFWFCQSPHAHGDLLLRGLNTSVGKQATTILPSSANAVRPLVLKAYMFRQDKEFRTRVLVAPWLRGNEWFFIFVNKIPLLAGYNLR